MRFLTILCWLFATTCLIADERKPNVIIFLADDQGWGDFSFHGNSNLATPHIDSLARDGASFENFYVCAVCAPTRAEFLTGRYHPQTGVSGVSEGAGRLNPDETTVADLFKRASYATGIFGKWHNGTQSPYHPMDRGFDEFYGFTSGHWGHYFSPPIDRNRERVKGEGYLTNDLTDHAIHFIEAHQDEPFFCYLPFNTPHSPFYVEDQFYEKFAGLDPTLRNRDPEKEDLAETRAALAMCENLDWNVGRVLETLESLGLRDETVVIYFSDNGPNTFRWNGGMKGKKATVDEGGLRSPLFVRWPGRIAKGLEISEIAGAIDLLPTLAGLTGIDAETPKPQDGINLAGRLLGESVEAADRVLFSAWRNKVSIRNQRFRLDQKGGLFEIENDRGQTHNVAAMFPEIASTLQTKMDAFQEASKQHFAAHADRPFTVGYHETTTLPARDGLPHGDIERSSKAPNNSFFTGWTSDADTITWDIEVGEARDYQATVFYTCPEANVGGTVRLESRAQATEAQVKVAFDPPLWDKSKERVEESHYLVKDFAPLDLGVLQLSKGRQVLTLSAPTLVGGRSIDVFSVRLDRP